MKKILICLIAACSVLTLQAKTWKIIGKALDADTTSLVQDATNTNVYKYVGKLKNLSFKLFDGTTNYVSTCGVSDPFEQQINMEQQTDASQFGFKVTFVNPNSIYRITLTDGTTPKIIVEKAIPYDRLFLIGGPVNTHNPNWLLSDARELEKDPTNPFVFYYRGFLRYNTFGDERGSIKFLTSNAGWDPAFHPVGSSNVALSLATKMRIGGSDTKWELPADGSRNGYYVLKLNTLDETISIEEFTYANVDFPNNVFITGDAMPCGWVNDVPETMTPTNLMEGKYTWTGNLIPGQFKFLKMRGTWGSCYVSTVENQPIQYGTQYPIVYEFEYYNNGGKDYKFQATEAKKCTINLDLVAMKIVVNQASSSPVEDVKPNNKVDIYAANGKIIINNSSNTKKNIAILTVDGKGIYKSTLESHSEVSLSKGCYIVNISDNQSEQCEKVIVTN